MNNNITGIVIYIMNNITALEGFECLIVKSRTTAG